MAKFIKLDQAEKLTHSFQHSEVGKGQTVSGRVEKDFILEILKQNNCDGINIYPAMNEEGKITFVLVGYSDANGDLLTGSIVDQLNLCPPNCPNSNSSLKSS